MKTYLSFPFCLLLVIAFTFLSSGELCGQLMPGTLSFQSAPLHPFGYSRLDVVWSGQNVPNDGNSYWLRVNVELNNGTTNGQCVHEAFTEGSLNAVFDADDISASSTTVNLTVPNIQSLNLTDPMTLFSIFYVGSPGTFVFFGWNDGPNTNGIFELGGQFHPAITSLPPHDFFPARAISGSIYKAPITQSNCNGIDNAAVPGVDINLGSNVECLPAQQSQSTVNQSDGEYAFTVNELFDYSIAPVKDNNPDCGVNTTDYLMAWQHAGGAALLQYPYQVVAADMNLDHIVTMSDVVSIIHLINGNFEAPFGWRSWSFPPAIDYGLFPPVNSSNYFYPDYDEFIGILNLNNHHPNQDFVGIKRADVDGSCSDCDGEFQGNDVENRSATNTGLRFKDQAIEAGREVELPVYFRGIEKNTAALAFALSLPTEYFEMLTIKEGGLPNLNESYFNWDAMDDGLLRLAWLNTEGDDVSISENDPLFYIVVKTKQEIRSLKELLQLRPDIQDCSIANTELERNILTLEFSGEASAVEDVSVFPNPAKDNITISFNAPADVANAVLNFHGIDGKALATYDIQLSEGRHSVTIPTDKLTNGLISYQLYIGNRRYSGKFFKQD